MQAKELRQQQPHSPSPSGGILPMGMYGGPGSSNARGMPSILRTNRAILPTAPPPVLGWYSINEASYKTEKPYCGTVVLLA